MTVRPTLLGPRALGAAAAKVVNRLGPCVAEIGDALVRIEIMRLPQDEFLDVRFDDRLDRWTFRGRRLNGYPRTRLWWSLAGDPLPYLSWLATLPGLTGDRWLQPDPAILDELRRIAEPDEDGLSPAI